MSKILTVLLVFWLELYLYYCTSFCTIVESLQKATRRHIVLVENQIRTLLTDYTHFIVYQ